MDFRIRSGGVRVCIALLPVVMAVSCITPVDPLRADEAEYYSAYAQYSAGNYGEASQQFQNIINDYPYSNKLDDSQYYAGRCAMQIADTVVSSDVASAVEYYFDARSWFTEIDSRSTKYVKARYYRAKSAGEMVLAGSERMRREAAIAELGVFIARYPNHGFSDNALSLKLELEALQ